MYKFGGVGAFFTLYNNFNDKEVKIQVVLKFERIVIRMPNWIGDCVMATPVLTDVRKAFPKAHITVMCLKSMASLFSCDQDVDAVLTFERPKGSGKRAIKQEILKKLKEGRFDFGLLLTNSFSSAYWFWQAGVKERMGFSRDARRFFLTKPVDILPSWQSFHQVDVYKMLVGGLGVERSRTKPRLFCSADEIRRARLILKNYGVEHESIIGINPTASYGDAKCWLPERFVEVANRLSQRPNTRVVFFGDKTSQRAVGSICEKLPESVINLAGKTSLKDLICLTKLCQVMLSNDSGPMHIAAATGAPLVALFGSTNEVLTGPYTNKATIIHKHVSCSPCYLRTCPIDFKCMKRIETDEVYEKIIQWLEEPANCLSASYVHL